SRARRGIGRVVGCVDAAHRDAAHADGLADARVLVGEAGAGVVGAQRVAGDPVVRESHRGRAGAVVNLAHACGAHGESARGDVRSRARRGIGRVVGRIDAAHRYAAYADGLDDARVLVGEAGAR